MVYRTQLARDPLALTVLALLAERPRHPYEIQRLIRERRKDFALGPPRGLYHTVDRLLAVDLVEPAETSREGRRPERTVYQITDEGRAEFAAWLSELIATVATDFPPFTVALAFLGYLPVNAAVQALRTRAAVLDGVVADLDARLHGLQQQLHRLTLLELEHTRALRQAELEWVRALIADIRDGRLSWDDEVLRAHPESLRLQPEGAQLSETQAPPRVVEGED